MKVDIHCEIKDYCYWMVLVEADSITEVFSQAKKLWIDCLDDTGIFESVLWKDNETRIFIENRINTAFDNFTTLFAACDEVSVNLPFDTTLTFFFK